MKATFSWIKNTLFCPQFSPQNAESRILGLWNFTVFWESSPRDLLPPRKRGLTAPCWYSRLLYSNLLAISIFISETPAYHTHLVHILQNTSCIRKPQVKLGGGVGGPHPSTLPLEPPLLGCRSISSYMYFWLRVTNKMFFPGYSFGR